MSKNPTAFHYTTAAGTTGFGMTLRDYFAAKAMQAIIAKAPLETTSVRNAKSKVEIISAGAYLYADAMLEARK